MRSVIRGKNVDVTDRIRTYAERKLVRIERFLDDRTDAVLELSEEQHRSDADSQIADLTLVIDGQTIHSRAAAPTHQAAIDAAVDKAERQAVDRKEKPLAARSSAGRQVLERLSGGTSDPNSERRIVKTKRFDIEPMFEEDAVAGMEELGHAFYIFVNAENERLNILYRRADGNYGIIEPAITGDSGARRDSRDSREAGRRR